MEDLIGTGHDDDAVNLGHCHRYIDDLISFNDEGYLANCFSDIYPEELVLNQTNSSPTSATYLDLQITVNDNGTHFNLVLIENMFNVYVIPVKAAKITSPSVASSSE